MKRRADPDEAIIKEWLRHLRPLRVSRRTFNRTRRQLSKLANRQAPVNDTIWAILNSLVAKHAGNDRSLYRIYLEQAELVASEGKDPSRYLYLAGQYSPTGYAELQRHEDPMDIMIRENNEAYALEKQGHIPEALAIYESLRQRRYPHPKPYERMRILYTKQKDYRKAIRACKAFIRVHKRVGYPARAERLAQWIPKLEAKLEKQKQVR